MCSKSLWIRHRLRKRLDSKKRQQENRLKKQKIKEKQTNYQSNEVRKLIASLEQLANGHLSINVKVEDEDEDTQTIAKNFEKSIQVLRVQ